MTEPTAESVAREIMRQIDIDWEMFDGRAEDIDDPVEWTPAMDDLRDAIAAALRQCEAAEREARRERDAAIADGYSRRMMAAAVDLGSRGKPHIVADSKADAGISIAAAIRRATP